MIAWIKTPLGMEVGLGPGDFVLDGDPAPLPISASAELLYKFREKVFWVSMCAQILGPRVYRSVRLGLGLGLALVSV